MELETGKISDSQLRFLIIGFIMGSLLIFSPLTSIVRQNSWLVLFAGLGISLIFALLIVSLAQKFPGQTLVQFNDIIYGPYIGKVISLFYILYFFHLSSLNLRDFGELYPSTLMTETPMFIFLILIAAAAVVVTRNGIETLCRTAAILVVGVILVFLIDFALLLGKTNLANLLPFFNIPVMKLIQGIHVALSVSFGETIVFLMILPYSYNIKRVRLSFCGALIVGGTIVAMATFRDAAVLGNTELIETYTSFQAVRLINIGEFLTRLEILTVNVQLAIGFIKIAVLFYATVLGISQLLRMRSYLPLVFPIGVMVVVISFSQYDFYPRAFDFVTKISPFYEFPFQFLLPLISLIIIKIRGISQKQER